MRPRLPSFRVAAMDRRRAGHAAEVPTDAIHAVDESVPVDEQAAGAEARRLVLRVLSTIDLDTPSGANIPIEERTAEEVAG